MNAAALEKIFSHAETAYPAECCGLVVLTRFNEVEVVRCDNTSPEPEKSFQFDAKCLHEALKLGEIMYVYHSHPDAPPTPSTEDVVQSEELALPFFIVSWPDKQTAEYKPVDMETQLLARPFIYGVYDCSTLCRDYYRQKLKIEVADYPFYGDGWWNNKSHENTYAEGLRERGFVEVPDLRLHDLILMQVLSEVPNHLAIYQGDHYIMHHLYGRKSELAVYGGSWEKASRSFFRHQSIL